MKKLSKVMCLILALTMIVSFAGCKKAKELDNSSDSSEISSEISSTVENTDGENSAIQNTSEIMNSSKPSSSSKPTVSAESGSWKALLQQMPSNLKGTTIEIFHWNPVSELPNGKQVLSNFQKQTKIKVNWKVASYDNYDIELQARVAAGKSPDVVLFQWMNVNRMKLCQPISNVSFDFNNSVWDSELMKYYTVNGKTYAVNMNGTYLNRPAAVMYNKNLIEKYEYEDPYTLWKQGKWTESKFMEMCKDFKRKTNSPAWVVSKYDVWSLLLGLQCELSFNNGKYGNNLKDTRAVTAWQRGAELFNSGLVDRSWDMNGFESGKYLFMDTSLMYTRTTQPYFSDMKSSGTLGVVPFFTIEGQSTQYQLMSEYEAYGFAKGAKNTTAAAYFLRYYLDPESYNSKTFFFSEQAKEVYEYSMKQPNRIMHNRFPLGGGNSQSPIADVRLALQAATPDQVPTVLNKYMSVVDACVIDLNNRLSELS